jgi:hypothetical protein
MTIRQKECIPPELTHGSPNGMKPIHRAKLTERFEKGGLIHGSKETQELHQWKMGGIEDIEMVGGEKPGNG